MQTMLLSRTVLIALAVLIAAGPVAPAQDGELEEILTRMEKRVETLEKFAWNVRTFSGIRNFSSDKGIDVHGRYRRGVGIRTQITHLGCADASVKPSTGGPNHFVLVHTPEAVSCAMTMVKLELPLTDALMPFALFRARPGEEAHGAIEPTLLPWRPMPEFLYLDDPIIKFTLAPRVLFGHEPSLAVTRMARFEGVECAVLESSRDANAVAEGMDPDWHPALSVRKRFYVSIPEAQILGLEIEAKMKEETGSSSLSYRARVVERAVTDGVDLPRQVEISVRDREGEEPLVFVLKDTPVLEDR